jgi:hypothetical protein
LDGPPRLRSFCVTGGFRVAGVNRSGRGTASTSPATLACWAAGITVAQIARGIGCSPSYVSLQLSGRRPLSPEVVAFITDVAGDLAVR